MGDNRTRTAGNILLVGKHQQESILHFAIIDDLVKLRASLLHTVSVTGVDDEDQALCAGVVVPPQRADLVLATDIPHIEFHVLVGDALDVKADGGNSGDILVAQFQFVENRWQTLASSTMQMQREDSLLVFPAASKPSIRMRISFVPKIFPIILDT